MITNAKEIKVYMVAEEESGSNLTVVLRNGVILEGVIFDITDAEDGERYVVLDGIDRVSRIKRIWLFRDREVAATGKIGSTSKETG
jgi:hypothetical protein